MRTGKPTADDVDSRYQRWSILWEQILKCRLPRGSGQHWKVSPFSHSKQVLRSGWQPVHYPHLRGSVWDRLCYCSLRQRSQQEPGQLRAISKQ
eukprot:766858-Hanusia_phi.AAC.9